MASPHGEGDLHTIDPKRGRSQHTCSTCRIRRIRCDGAWRYPRPCTACERLGKSCDAQEWLPNRKQNDKSELSAQLARLEDLLELVDGGDERTYSHVVPADADLVGSMMRLCFNDQPEMRRAGSDHQHGLLEETAAWLKVETPDKYGRFGEPPHGADDLDRNAIIDMLPTRQAALSLSRTSTQFSVNTFHISYLFGPRAYAHVVDNLTKESGSHLSALSGSQLAELHSLAAFLSLDQIWTSGSTRWAAPGRTDQRYDRVLLHIKAAKRALVLHDYLENPDLPTLRSLCLLSLIEIYSFPTTEWQSRGLALGATAISLAEQLELHREDIERSESAVDRHERRAVLTALLQTQWDTSASLGRLAPVRDSMYAFPCADWLSDSELSPSIRKRPRPDRREYKIWALHHHMTGLAHQASAKLSDATRSFTLKDLSDFEKRVLVLEADCPKEWQYSIDDEGNITNGVTADTDMKERILALYFCDALQRIKLIINRLFIMAPSAAVPDSVLQRQRIELVMNARLQLQTWIMLSSFGTMCFGSISGGFQSFIISALALALDSDMPGRHRLQAEMKSLLNALQKHTVGGYFLPPAVRRVVSILRFLLNRPVVREAEAGTFSSKRVKAAPQPFFGFALPVNSGSEDALDHRHKACSTGSVNGDENVHHDESISSVLSTPSAYPSSSTSRRPSSHSDGDPVHSWQNSAFTFDVYL